MYPLKNDNLEHIMIPGVSGMNPQKLYDTFCSKKFTDHVNELIDYCHEEWSTTFMEKIIACVYHRIVPIRVFLDVHSITPQILWDMYFYNLNIDDYSNLTELYTNIVGMYDGNDMPIPNMNIDGIYVVEL